MMCRTMHNTFHFAVTYLKTEIGRLFPDGDKGNGLKCHISAASTGGKKKNFINGVDYSDLSRWFTHDEFRKLPGYMRKRISTNKAHQDKNKSQIQKHKKAKVSSVDTSNSATSASISDHDDPTQNRLVATMINGMINITRHQTFTPVNFPHNGRNASIASSATNRERQSSFNESTTSVITFDHFGNPF